jgi:dCTP deaminase
MIRNSLRWDRVVSPSLPPKTATRGLSAGESYTGYDLRIGDQWAVFSDDDLATAVILGMPSSYPEMHMKTGDAVLRPAQTILAHTLETVSIPIDCVGILVGRSTAARLGVMLNVTPIEPGWRGQITLEITNVSPRKIIIPAGSGIAQLLLMQTEAYRSYTGRYENQVGVTPPK